jgi:hypothetical protein
MSDVASLLKQMREQREFRVELEAGDGRPAKRVWLLRPLEAAELHLVATGVSVDAIVRFTTRWEGFTEADLLPGAGASDAVDYHADLWREMVGDRRDWAKRCAEDLVAQIARRASERQAASGNS